MFHCELWLTVRRQLTGSPQRVSSGRGPERAVLHEVIRSFLNDKAYWNYEAGESTWARPVWAPVLPRERRTRWKTMGTFLLLHLLTLGNGPEPVSPFLMYLLLTGAVHRGEEEKRPGPVDSEVDLGVLYKLDAKIADSLRPWMVLKGSDRLKGLTGRPGAAASLQSLLSQCNLQVRSFLDVHVEVAAYNEQLNFFGGEVRDERDHEGLTSALINAMFLGCDHPENTKEFEYLLDGFTVPLSEENDFTITKVVSSHVLCTWK